ncbi:MAG: hypothetical protein EA398_14395 [Deltaproteobacteria bacterium]|nr:MAG: hypothetical protein EA398_14395 [Deltaproteobacteria bacterium]
MSTTVWLKLLNFRALDHFDCEFGGVSLLAGANGTGKTSVLKALLFFRNYYLRGPDEALNALRPQSLRSFGANGDELVVMALRVGDVVWAIRMPTNPSGLIEGDLGERVSLRKGYTCMDWLVAPLGGGPVSVRSEDGEEPAALSRSRTVAVARQVRDRMEPEWIEPLHAAMEAVRVHDGYWFHEIRQASPVHPGHRSDYLAGNGTNLWSVLANWKSAPSAYGHRFEWVVQKMRDVFPEQFTDLEFPSGQASFIVPGRPNSAEGLPPALMAHGVITGLLHLTAVAGAPRGAIVGIDEVETHLHPQAIRGLLAAIRERADDQGLHVLVTTHSPVVMNTFRDEPERFFVMERKEDLQGRPNPLCVARRKPEAEPAVEQDEQPHREVAPDLSRVPPREKLEYQEYLQMLPGDLYDSLLIGAPRKHGD